MNSKTPLKLTLDAVMIVLFTILLNAFSTGLAFHEIAGLTIVALFMIHIILNWKWVINVTKNLLNTSFKTKPKIMYALNALLLIGISTITITGILISRVVFNFGAGGNNHLLVATHKWVSYACLGLFIIHIALHWHYILISVRSIFSTIERNKIRKAIGSIGAAALVIVVFYSLIMPGSDKTGQQAASSPEMTTPIRKNDYSQNSEIQKYKTTDDQDYTISNNAQNNTKAAVSLSDYLGNMFCTGCDKHCPLLRLKCDKGNSQLQAAKIQYQKLYGETASD